MKQQQQQSGIAWAFIDWGTELSVRERGGGGANPRTSFALGGLSFSPLGSFLFSPLLLFLLMISLERSTWKRMGARVLLLLFFSFIEKRSAIHDKEIGLLSNGSSRTRSGSESFFSSFFCVCAWAFFRFSLEFLMDFRPSSLTSLVIHSQFAVFSLKLQVVGSFTEVLPSLTRFSLVLPSFTSLSRMLGDFT